MPYRLVDILPSVSDQQVVSAPVDEGKRGHLHDINQLAWLEHRARAGAGIDALVAFSRLFRGHGHTLIGVSETVNASAQFVTLRLVVC